MVERRDLLCASDELVEFRDVKNDVLKEYYTELGE
jgi:hypothetical protein